jgi:hypothetical protein
MSTEDGRGDTVSILYLLYHCVAVGLIAAAIIALVMGVVGWIVFTAWIILTIALYVGGWICYLMVMRDLEPWDIALGANDDETSCPVKFRLWVDRRMSRGHAELRC